MDRFVVRHNPLVVGLWMLFGLLVLFAGLFQQAYLPLLTFGFIQLAMGALLGATPLLRVEQGRLRWCAMWPLWRSTEVCALSDVEIQGVSLVKSNGEVITHLLTCHPGDVAQLATAAGYARAA